VASRKVSWTVFVRLLGWVGLAIVAALLGLVALLAMSPPYAGLGTWDQFQTLLVLAPVRTYLFRSAAINTGWLYAGVAPLALLLGWGWARLGINASTRPLLLLPLLFPSALTGLLWQPHFAGWLDLAQAELSLAITGLVILWRIVPLAAWFMAQERRAWRIVLSLSALLILLDGAFILTFTGGEPYNTTHTWASWMVQQLWVNRAWGYAASMAGGLALVVALVTWFAPPQSESSRSDLSPVAPSQPVLGLLFALGWVLGPFFVHLAAFHDASIRAISILIALGAIGWLFNGALLWVGATLLALFLMPPTAASLAATGSSRWVRAITMTLLPISTVALAYLVEQWPILGNRWTLMGLTGLFTAGLLAGDTPALLQPYQHWFKVAGWALLVMAHSFPLQLVLQLPASAWTPVLGVVWTLGNAPHLSAAQGLALLLCGLVAWGGGWIAMSTPETLRSKAPSTEAEGELSAAG
jgi:hypothetical protein